MTIGRPKPLLLTNRKSKATMNESATLLAAFTVGLLGNVHCLGMCGGIATAIGVSTAENRVTNVLLFNAGRVATYCLLGATIGVLGQGFVQLAPAIGPWFRILAGLLLIAMGLYINQWWMGLTALERVGAVVWNPIKPVFTDFSKRSGYANKVLLGLLWGFLPCGLVYSVLGWSLASADPLRSALLMGCFGLGTLPGMVASGITGQALMRKLREKRVRAVIGVLLIAFGLWTIVAPLRHMMMAGDEHSHHQHMQTDM